MRITRVNGQDATTPESRRELRYRTLKAPPNAGYGASRHARGFTPLALSVGYLNKEIFMLCSLRGAGWEADDRQGNRVSLREGADLFL